MLLIQNAHVIDPASGRSEECDILVQGERIAQIGKSLPAPEGECGIIDARWRPQVWWTCMCISGNRDSLIRRIFTQVPPPLPGEVLPLW